MFLSGCFQSSALCLWSVCAGRSKGFICCVSINRKRNLDCERPPSILTFKYQPIEAHVQPRRPSLTFPSNSKLAAVKQRCVFVRRQSELRWGEAESAPRVLSEATLAEHVGTSLPNLSSRTFYLKRLLYKCSHRLHNVAHCRRRTHHSC